MTAPAPTRAEEGREYVEDGCRVVYGRTWDGPFEKMPTEGMKDVWRDLVRKAQQPIATHLSAAEARAAQAEAEVVRLTAENERLHIAFLVLSESGHGGGMYEVRRWFNSGTAKPIPWPSGVCFAAWAAEHSIFDCNGAMGFRRRDALKGGDQ